MIKKTQPNIEILLEKPLWQMTGKDFCILTDFANSQRQEATSSDIVRITGVRALAEYLNCCESTVFMLRRNGVLDETILSQVGKKIVFDGEKARAAADDFQKTRRSQNSIKTN